MVNLNAYVSGGVRTVEGSYSYIFGVGQCRALLLYADIQIRLAIFASASRPVWKSFSWPFRTNSKSAANGLVSNAETKMPFGLAFGSATTM